MINKLLIKVLYTAIFLSIGFEAYGQQPGQVSQPDLVDSKAIDSSVIDLRLNSWGHGES